MHLRRFAILALLPVLAWAQDPAAPDHWPAALAGVANMGFADDRPGDGTGGWSDQGWANSFAEFEVARREFGGVPFAITDPRAVRRTGGGRRRRRCAPGARHRRLGGRADPVPGAGCALTRPGRCGS
jgi:hypothetical protein